MAELDMLANMQRTVYSRRSHPDQTRSLLKSCSQRLDRYNTVTARHGKA